MMVMGMVKYMNHSCISDSEPTGVMEEKDKINQKRNGGDGDIVMVKQVMEEKNT